MSYQTPLSKLGDSLNVPATPFSLHDRISTVATAASERIEQLENKLSSTIAMAIVMAQELQEIIADAEQAGCPVTLPATQAVIDLWEALYQEQDLINEASL